MKNEIIILPGIPVSDYPNPPKGQPGAYKTICPECSELIWFTPKKKKYLEELEENKQPHLVACWICIKKDLEHIHESQFSKVDI